IAPALEQAAGRRSRRLTVRTRRRKERLPSRSASKSIGLAFRRMFLSLSSISFLGGFHRRRLIRRLQNQIGKLVIARLQRGTLPKDVIDSRLRGGETRLINALADRRGPLALLPHPRREKRQDADVFQAHEGLLGLRARHLESQADFFSDTKGSLLK